MSSSFGDKAKAIIAAIAPMLGTAVGGPFGALAGLAISKALGTTKSDGTADDAASEAALLAGNPEALLALKKADADFQEQMRTLQISEEKLSFDDVANARGREIAVKDSTPRQLAWALIGGFIVITGGLLLAMIVWPDQVKQLDGQAWLLIGSLTGYLANEAKQCAGYYFGSTMSSQAKDVTIADIAKQP